MDITYVSIYNSFTHGKLYVEKTWRQLMYVLNLFHHVTIQFYAMYVHVRMYVCMYVCITEVCSKLRTQDYTYIFCFETMSLMHAHTCTHIHTHMHTHTCMHSCTHTRARTHTRTHTHTHTCTHTHAATTKSRVYRKFQ